MATSIGPRYLVALHDLAAHRFGVSLTLPKPQARQRLSLPVWIPGSYLVREFSRHMSGLSATQSGGDLPLVQVDKNSWEVVCDPKRPLVLHYLVYAHDASVRTAFLNSQRGFFNGSSLLLRAHGFEAQPHSLRLGPLPKGWQVATAMPAAPGARHWQAADYDELVDHPFELGAFWRGEFKAHGVPHEFVLAGAWPGFDGQRLLADTQAICEAQMRFWHGPKGKPPFKRYCFMLAAVEDGYGGLEHRASTALIAARRDLPRAAPAAPAEAYSTLLGLISHEYFHTWNVKRLRPASLVPLDYSRENYTELLWFFEGFTSYYDDLLLLRSGRIQAGKYLGLLAKAISGVLAVPGRHVHSLAQASFEAWTKYYRPDENTPNATVSYYAKGSLVALALDLRLRAGAAGAGKAASLDEVMRGLWRRCKAGDASQGGAVGAEDIWAVVAEQGGAPLARQLQAWVEGLEDPPLQSLLQAAGVAWRSSTPDKLAARWGLRLSEVSGQPLLVQQVLTGSAAAQAGLSAGDELLAVDGWRIKQLDDARQWLRHDAPAQVLLSRQQRVMTLSVAPPPSSQMAPQVSLTLAEDASPAALVLRKAWLGS